MHIITVSEQTSASAEAIWELFADVNKRRLWDDSIKDITIDGPFKKGMTGTITLNGQPKRAFTILEAQPTGLYIDRFHLPLGAYMDWVHSVTDNGPDRTITFDVSVHGITAPMLGVIMKMILKKELPVAVQKLAAVAQ